VRVSLSLWFTKFKHQSTELDIITVHDKLTRLRLFHLKSVMLDHFIAKSAAAHKVYSYYTLAIPYCTFYVGKQYFSPCTTYDGVLSIY